MDEREEWQELHQKLNRLTQLASWLDKWLNSPNPDSQFDPQALLIVSNVVLFYHIVHRSANKDPEGKYDYFRGVFVSRSRKIIPHELEIEFTKYYTEVFALKPENAEPIPPPNEFFVSFRTDGYDHMYSLTLERANQIYNYLKTPKCEGLFQSLG